MQSVDFIKFIYLKEIKVVYHITDREHEAI